MLMSSATTSVTIDGSGNLQILDLVGSNNHLKISYDSGTGKIVLQDLDGNSITSSVGTGSGTSTVMIDPASFAGHIIFNSGDGDDTLTVDDSIAGSGKDIQYDGGAGNDTLVVKGNGGTSTTYTPSNTTNGSGSVAIGSSEVDFQNLSPVDISGFANVTVASPANAANALVLDAGFDSASGGTHPAIVVTGNTGLGMTGIESAHLWNNTNVFIDTGATTGAGTNTITVNSAIALGHLNTNLTLTTNSNGSVSVNAALAVSGTLAVNSPTVNLNANLAATTLTGTAATVTVQSNAAQIQDGVNVAASGATVNVAAGTYNELVTVTKTLTFLGAQHGVDARARRCIPSRLCPTATAIFRSRPTM